MNWITDTLARRPFLPGIWLTTDSSVAAELAAGAGFDWALLDLEHGLGDLASVRRQIELLSPTACAPVVRVPSVSSEALPRVLDFGAAGVMAPMIESADQAAALVRALRYPPAGVRGLTRSSRASGYGRGFPAYFRDANTKLLAIAQIETARAVEQADAIAATEGIGVLFIGHSDLSLNLGCADAPDAPAVREAEQAVLAACARHGKKAGMLLKSGMPLAAYREKGFALIAMGSDLGCLKAGFDRLRQEAKAASPARPATDAGPGSRTPPQKH